MYRRDDGGDEKCGQEYLHWEGDFENIMKYGRARERGKVTTIQILQ